MPLRDTVKTVAVDGFTKTTLVDQAHENKIYSLVEPTNRKEVAELAQKTRNELSGRGKGMDFILTIPEADYHQALLKYDFHSGSMEDRRREAERAARDNPHWVAYSKNPRRFARRK